MEALYARFGRNIRALRQLVCDKDDDLAAAVRVGRAQKRGAHGDSEVVVSDKTWREFGDAALHRIFSAVVWVLE